MGQELAPSAFEGWPCHIAADAVLGRYLVASSDIASGQVVLLSEAYLTALIPSYKKRICHFCLKDHQKRLIACCRQCNQTWYCSAQCQEAHWSGYQKLPANQGATRSVSAHTKHMVPHSLTCAVLKRFSSIKCDPSMESVIRMCLDAIALLMLEKQTDGMSTGPASKEQTGPANQSACHAAEQCDRPATQHSAQEVNSSQHQPHNQLQLRPHQQQQQQQAHHLPLITHHDLMHLHSHAAEFAGKDRRDWLINIRFLKCSMQQAGWPGPFWSDDELLDMVGRIASNNFGIYSSRQRQQLQNQDTSPVQTDDFEGAGAASVLPNVAQESVAEPMPASKTCKGISPLPSPSPDADASAVPTCIPLWPTLSSVQQQLAKSFSLHEVNGNAAACNNLGKGASFTGSGLESLMIEAQSCEPEHLHSKASVDGSFKSQPHAEANPTRGDVSTAFERGGVKPAKEDVIGREMYITASYFNHSCEPNCVKNRTHEQQSGTASVTSLMDIKAGEALTISYIDLELPRSARQLELKTSFFFDCKCIRCERELTEGSKKCSYTHSQSRRKSQGPKRRGLKARVSR